MAHQSWRHETRDLILPGLSQSIRIDVCDAWSFHQPSRTFKRSPLAHPSVGWESKCQKEFSMTKDSGCCDEEPWIPQILILWLGYSGSGYLVLLRSNTSSSDENVRFQLQSLPQYNLSQFLELLELVSFPSCDRYCAGLIRLFHSICCWWHWGILNRYGTPNVHSIFADHLLWGNLLNDPPWPHGTVQNQFKSWYYLF